MLAEEGRERAEYTRQNEEYVAQRDALKQKLSLLRRETDCYEMDVMRESRRTGLPGGPLVLTGRA